MTHNDKSSKGNIPNVYAKNVRGEEVFVSDVESGGKGYFCLGCDKPLLAIKSKTGRVVDHFRHDWTKIPKEQKCTYSDETYRHKLAKEILQRLKQIKVPALYKYPPIQIDGFPMFLQSEKFIDAERVEVEMSFFETENGDISFGRQFNVNEKYLLIRPDITFFKDNKPILFIEIVATHGVTEDKLLKLRRLGIDTVQVQIPKDSPSSIEESFKHTVRTKWVYNYEEASTQYIRVSNSDAERISSIDEDQKKLFGESFRCRLFQIKEIIRRVRVVVESGEFREIEQSLNEEIRRVEGNTERERRDRDSFYSEAKGRVQEEFAGEFQKYRDLEERYYRKIEQIRSEEEKLERRADLLRNGEWELQREIKRIEEQERAISAEEENIKLEEKQFAERLGGLLASSKGRDKREGETATIIKRIQEETRGLASRKKELVVIRDNAIRSKNTN